MKFNSTGGSSLSPASVVCSELGRLSLPVIFLVFYVKLLPVLRSGSLLLRSLTVSS